MRVYGERRYVSRQLVKQRESAAAAELCGSAEEMASRNLKLELAQQIVKLIRQNPAFASDAEYSRIVDLISQYTLAIKEQA